jgi:hypothetical protein
MIIECNEITQTANELQIAFQDCNKIKNSDLRKLVDLVIAVSTCSNGGPNYNTLISTSYTTPQTVTFPINNFHSYSLNVLSGSIEYEGFNFPSGSTRNVEYTTLNQNSVTFIVNSGSEVLFEYLIETIV